MSSLTREELAVRCGSTSFDNMSMDFKNKQVIFTHSFRDQQGTVLEEFRTEVHFSVLQPRPLTQPEERALLAFGLCHSTFVFLASAKRSQLLQVRAGYFSPDELAFFRPALAGALAEYFYLADLDLADFRLECCCDPPLPALLSLPSNPVAAAEEPPPSEPEDAAPAATTATADTDSMSPTATPSSPRHNAATEAKATEATLPTLPTSPTSPRHPPRVLVPFGGGKDSTLLMELLGRMGAQEVGWVYFGEWVGSWEVYSKFTQLAAVSPAPTVFLAEQDTPCFGRLKELNLLPDLPFQDYCASVSFYTFAAAFVALQQDFDYICVGNEYSANAINTTHPKYNFPVNHQYEKSFAAECAFHTYLRNYVHPRLYYFSGLQHMTELEIAKRFAAICAAKYLDLIISCNWAMDNDWCGGCEKCAFVFLLFAAFLPTQEIMSKVFGVFPSKASDSVNGGGDDTRSPIVPGSRESLRGVYDMYDSERHVPVFESLMGLAGHKPFECVGTPEECLAALYLAYERLSSGSDASCSEDSVTDVDAGAGADRYNGAASEPKLAETDDSSVAKEQQQEQQKAGKRLPLLLRKHEDLITSQGKEEWEKIYAEIRLAQETGRPSVPTLYPDWFKLDMGSR
ncbi:hypothetical protein VaNZ11_016347 [Volvox africanus]|uniref:UDP-N-acetyl-alpha-D-muramoyl-L-alanyl-L-glutamate epimerase n=1 Tax=Volvox africanus TaxID=51714 RepID=A0ABQ5SNJ0_9CHLO|nr:hypothetical protein VaNZ11_016347 [Volvox africanus]